MLNVRCRGSNGCAASRRSIPGVAPDDSVSREFAELKPRDRALLWLAYVEEHNHQEIASALGLARGSVKVLLSRARGPVAEAAGRPKD